MVGSAELLKVAEDIGMVVIAVPAGDKSPETDVAESVENEVEERESAMVVEAIVL